MMELTKGMIIRETKTNSDEMFKDTCANSTLTYVVRRVNKKTYGLECIEGYAKGIRCNLLKSFPEISTDVYGTVTKREIVKEA